ncbi:MULTISPECIES: DEAD/DEAH box helicase [Campylobacter]|uniref:DEAD/DEAH box helicase n=1 Tax=Campylobacter TaxID=194 RepID=UPI000B15F4D8|nr:MULTISPECIES: DEAD/DEAH box helicase [Campylobacter]ECK2571425.1 DEAD/DEAH box helicase [Campylobacter jejuni]EIK2209438.1 DEAD/DEAH box helicase [Campylobacter jejuni]EIK2209931.1 DEAD/DEAH box helicase [Campylobacter jejuni]HBK6302160.1 DEAD/DEAH box helicase [Campylobacter jejuni]HEC1701314.1 DEAD/DEAH box helicase [Campylobacter jejuni]
MTSEKIFDECVKIYENLNDNNKETEAKEKLFYLLDEIQDKALYPPILNHLIRQFGLYPYMNQDTSILEDKFLLECFKANIGEDEPKVLHREQSRVLKRLLSDKSLILSAPTSFGKSFIIDALIAMKKPKNVLIIVPTISLLDEARRRLVRKFYSYNIITTTQQTDLKNNNIFIFSPERAVEYFSFINKENIRLDFFIVDEFYKISKEYGNERFAPLQNAILKYMGISDQRYYICPNIDKIKNENSILCKGMKFECLDFNTVFIHINKCYKNKDFKKEEKILEIVKKDEKTLVYTQSQNSIKTVCKILTKNIIIEKSNALLENFVKWLSIHYGEYYLNDILKVGVGIHHGKLHRCLSQLQVRLFEEKDSLKTIVSTSSLIEGVNIPAKNLILWDKKNGSKKINHLTYKNIIGRSGRMFKYFIGEVYLFESPNEDDNQEKILDVEIKSESLSINDEINNEIPDNIQAEVKNNQLEIIKLIGKDKFNLLKKETLLKNDLEVIIKIIQILQSEDFNYEIFTYLFNDEPDKWYILSKIASIREFHCNNINNTSNINNIELVKKLSQNWTKPLPKLIKDMGIDLDDFFKFENHVAFKIASLFSDINTLQKILYPEKGVDISSFVTKLSNVFLPSVVYTLEEFGLPRIISKKLHECGFINFENKELTLEQALDKFKEHTADDIINILKEKNLYDDFEDYILNYFYDGLGQ